MGKIPQYTEEFKRNIVNIYRSGKATTEIAHKYGLSQGALYKWIKKYGEIKISETETRTADEIPKSCNRLKENDYPGELIFFSAITGAVAALIKLLVHHIFLWTGLSVGFYEMLTAYLTHGHMKLENFTDRIFGEMTDMAIGAMFGILLGFWLKGSRLKYHWWIGLGYGFGIWSASLAFGNLTKILKKDMTDPWSLFSHLVAMLTFGVVFVLACRFWKPLRNRIEMGDNQES